MKKQYLTRMGSKRVFYRENYPRKGITVAEVYDFTPMIRIAKLGLELLVITLRLVALAVVLITIKTATFIMLLLRGKYLTKTSLLWLLIGFQTAVAFVSLIWITEKVLRLLLTIKVALSLPLTTGLLI